MAATATSLGREVVIEIAEKTTKYPNQRTVADDVFCVADRA
jgi:hypothetical protein